MKFKVGDIVYHDASPDSLYLVVAASIGSRGFMERITLKHYRCTGDDWQSGPYCTDNFSLAKETIRNNKLEELGV
jgi:hypothetical protein